MKKQHLCATVIKCDELEHLEEVKEIDGGELLFTRGFPSDYFDDDMILVREDILKEFFEQYVLTTRESRAFVKNHMGSYSYHCVSALGCGTRIESENGIEIAYLKNPRNPIRLAEPLVYCLKRKWKDLGWNL